METGLFYPTQLANSYHILAQRLNSVKRLLLPDSSSHEIHFKCSDMLTVYYIYNFDHFLFTTGKKEEITVCGGGNNKDGALKL